jgi:hypothetical protein
VGLFFVPPVLIIFFIFLFLPPPCYHFEVYHKSYGVVLTRFMIA